MNLTWKERQHMYHRKAHVVDIHNAEQQIFIDMTNDELCKWAIEYFKRDFNCCIYPAKSFSVAYIYAVLIKEVFEPQTPLIELLRDPYLLYGNDPFFEPYNDETSFIYEQMIQEVGNDIYGTNQSNATIEFFRKEMLLSDV